jgi:hypothetical protein
MLVEEGVLPPLVTVTVKTNGASKVTCAKRQRSVVLRSRPAYTASLPLPIYVRGSNALAPSTYTCTILGIFKVTFLTPLAQCARNINLAYPCSETR